MKPSRKHTNLFLSLVAILLLLLGLAVSATAAGTLSRSEIDAIVSTTTDASQVASPFTAAVRAVRQSVVLIRNYATVSYGSSLYDFGFGFDFGFGSGGNRGGGREQLASTGSGTVISSYGHILTNYHVVEDATRLTVYDGENELEASLVTYDADKDIAVLLCPEIALPAVPLGDSDQLQEGEWAIVIGNPLGEDFFRSTTVGVVSSLEREITSEGKDKYGLKKTISNAMIQVDAAINSGNSGGGMFNVLGQLMGIPSIKYTSNFFSSSSIDNIGMCIPINSAKTLIQQALEVYDGEAVQQYLETKEKENDRINPLQNTDDIAERPRLGITMSTLSRSNNAVSRGVLPAGALVSQVEDASPAQEAGILPGDIIVEVDGVIIDSSTALQGLVFSHSAGDVLKITLYRAENVLDAEYISDIGEGEYIELEVTLQVVAKPAA